MVGHGLGGQIMKSEQAEREIRQTETEVANCPACCGLAIPELIKIPDHEYGLDYLATYACCQNCGTLYQWPMPSGKQLSSFYPPHYHSMVDGGFLLRMRHDMRISRLKTMVGNGETVLDFGCGNGLFLRRAASAMPEAKFIGYEIADQERKEEIAPRVVIMEGAFEECLSKLPPCRVIIMNHVIEHLPDPFSIVLQLREKLMPGGYFDGQTPNSVSLEHKIFGQLWSGFHAPRHTVIFSAEGLRRLLERAGFTEIKIKAAFNPAGYAISFASLPHGNHKGNIRRQGLKWLLYVAGATFVLPIDFWSGMPSMIDFTGVIKTA